MLHALVWNLLAALYALVRNARAALARRLVRARWVRLELGGSIAELPPRRRWLGLGSKGAASLGSRQALTRAIDVLLADRDLVGVVVELEPVHLGWARARDVRAELLRLRAGGKRLVVHLRSCDLRTYHLASVADRVLASPACVLSLVGLGLETTHARAALERLGVEIGIVAAGEYKSFGETFTRDAPSPEAREALDAILDTVWREVTAAVAASRGWDAAVAAARLGDGPYVAEAALGTGLVDGLCYRDEVARHLEAEALAPGAAGAPVLVPWARYLRARPWRPRWKRPRAPVIAVVSLDGVIRDGRSAASPVGGVAAGADSFTPVLERLREDRRVRAVVLRIDSRGGSATASDLMWHAVRRLAEEKPVVAHLGEIAASGGYYVACGARAIVASPLTLTGSIGVVAGKVTVRDGAARLGVSRTQLGRGAASGFHSPFVAFDEAARARLRREVLAFYETFKARVGAGRPLLTAEAIESAARGRVWTGAAAAELGLVDTLGTLTDAIDKVRSLANIPPDSAVNLVEVHHLPRRFPLMLQPSNRLAHSVLAPASALVALCEGGPRLLAYWPEIVTLD